MIKQVWIYAHYNKYEKEAEYQLSLYERSESSGDVLLEIRSVEFETPEEKKVRVDLAAALKLQLQIMRADHYKDQNEVQESINELLSLEYKPEKEQEIPVPVRAEPSSTIDEDIPF